MVELINPCRTKIFWKHSFEDNLAVANQALNAEDYPVVIQFYKHALDQFLSGSFSEEAMEMLRPRAASATSELSDCFLMLGDAYAATRVLDFYSKFLADDVHLVAKLGMLYIDRGESVHDLKKAVECFERVKLLDPDFKMNVSINVMILYAKIMSRQ